MKPERRNDGLEKGKGITVMKNSLKQLVKESEAIRKAASHHYRAAKVLGLRREMAGETREEVMAALRQAYLVEGSESEAEEGTDGGGR